MELSETGDRAIDSLFTPIFGESWKEIASLDAEQTVTSTLFGLINAAIAGFAVVFLIFMVALLIFEGSRHKKDFRAKYSAGFIGFRVFYGFVSILPIANGFSLMQAFILGVVVGLPINLANDLGNQLITEITKGNSIIKPEAASTYDLVNSLALSAVCQESLNFVGQRKGRTWITAKENTLATNFGEDKHTFTIGGRVTSQSGRLSGAVNLCGEYTSNCGSQEGDDFFDNDDVCELHRKLIKDTFNTLAASVRPVITDELRTRPFPPELIINAAINYDNRFKEGLKDVSDDYANKIDQKAKQTQEQIALEGFGSLGKWYMQISKINQSLTIQATSLPTFRPPRQDKMPSTVSHQYQVDRSAFLESVGKEVIATSENNREVVEDTQREIMDLNDGFLGIDNDTPFAWINPLVNTYEIDKEPIIALQTIGNQMVTAGSTILTTVTGIKAFSFVKSGSTPSLGFGKSSEAQEVSGAIVTLSVLLVIIGGLLAYWLPVAPFFFWIIALLNYALDIIEALLASSIWMASHLVPHGEGLAGQHGLKGYYFIFGLAVTPFLMVMALYFAILTMNVFTGFFVEEFVIYSKSIMDGQINITGFINNIGLSLTMVVGVITIINLTHQAIPDMGDKVMNFVGFETRQNISKNAEANIAGLIHTSESRTTLAVNEALAGISGSNNVPLPETPGGSSHDSTEDNKLSPNNSEPSKDNDEKNTAKQTPGDVSGGSNPGNSNSGGSNSGNSNSGGNNSDQSGDGGSTGGSGSDQSGSGNNNGGRSNNSNASNNDTRGDSKLNQSQSNRSTPLKSDDKKDTKFDS